MTEESKKSDQKAEQPPAPCEFAGCDELASFCDRHPWREAEQPQQQPVGRCPCLTDDGPCSEDRACHCISPTDPDVIGCLWDGHVQPVGPIAHVAGCRCHEQFTPKKWRTDECVHPVIKNQKYLNSTRVVENPCGALKQAHPYTDPRCKPQPPVVGHVARCKCHHPDIKCNVPKHQPNTDPRCSPGLLTLERAKAEARLEAMEQVRPDGTVERAAMTTTRLRQLTDEARAEVERITQKED